MVSRNFLASFLIICLLGIFSLTPLAVVSDVYQLIFAYTGIITFFRYRMYRNALLQVIMITVFAVVVSSFMSSTLNLGQDAFSALVAVQNLIKGFAVFTIVPWAISEKINWERIIKWIIRFGWLASFVVAILSIFWYNINFTSALSGVQYQITPERIDKNIIFFAIIYYLIQYSKFKDNKSIFLALILFATTQIYDIVRGDWLFMGFLTGVLFLRHMPAQNLIATAFAIVITGSIALLAMDTSGFREKFNQMFMLLNTEERSQIVEASVFVRIQEAQFAQEGFLRHPLFGNGLIRGSKKADLIGSVYFYPADVGLIGILYCFGIFGIFVFLVLAIGLYKLFKTQVLWPGEAFLYFGLFETLRSLKDGGVLLSSPGPIVLALVVTALHIVLKEVANSNGQKLREGNTAPLKGRFR